MISQSSYCSTNDRRLHFGLGDAETADLEIQWPGGGKQSFAKLRPMQLYVIKEGGGGGASSLAGALRRDLAGYQKGRRRRGGPDLPSMTLVEIRISTFLRPQFRGARPTTVSMYAGLLRNSPAAIVP